MSEKLEDDSKERVSRRQSQPKTVTGRTQWDALVDIFTTLGTVAPYIAFVGLGLFAFYKFTQLTEQNTSDLQKAQAEASQRYESQIATANKVLAETYDEIGKMSASQITNLNAMLDLHSKAAKQTQELQLSIQDLRQKAEEQQKESIANAEKSTAQLNALSTELQRVKGDKEKVEFDLITKLDQAQKLDTEIKTLTNTLTSKREALSTSADEISNIRRRAAELAQAVVESKPNADELANAIMKELGASNSQLFADLLHEDSRDKALKALIGLSEEELTSFLKQKGFLFAVRVPGSGGGHQYLAALGKKHDGVFGPILDVEVDKGRITSAIASNTLAAYKVPDPQDWYTDDSVIVLCSSGCSSKMFYMLNNVTTKIDLAHWSRKGENLVISEPNEDLKYATIDEIQTYQLNVFWDAEPDGNCDTEECTSVKLYNRAKTLDIESLFVGDVAKLPVDSQNALKEIFRSALRRDQNLGSLIESQANVDVHELGFLASGILRPGFSLSLESKSGSGSDSHIILRGEFAFDRDPFGHEKPKKATIRIELGASDGMWRLAKLEHNVSTVDQGPATPLAQPPG